MSSSASELNQAARQADRQMLLPGLAQATRHHKTTESKEGLRPGSIATSQTTYTDSFNQPTQEASVKPASASYLDAGHSASAHYTLSVASEAAAQQQAPPQYVQSAEYRSAGQRIVYTQTEVGHRNLQLAGAQSEQQQRRVSAQQLQETRVLRREVGPHRLVSVTERVDESRSQIVNERTTQHEIRVPRRILREEIIEKVIIVPEKKVVEEIVDDIRTVKETIIEVAKPTIVEKVIEVPEIEIVERIVEVPEKKTEERIVYIDKVVEQKRTVGEPTIVYVDKEVEVPVPVDVWRDVEKVVEVPEWYDEIIYKEVRVPQYKDSIVERNVEVAKQVDIYRDVPVPVEAEISYEYRLPQLKPRYAKVTYPVYLPRFIEIPVAAELFSPELIAKAQSYMSQVALLRDSRLSLCEIEQLATSIMQTDFDRQIASADLQVAILKAWHAGSVQLTSRPSTQGRA